MDVNIKRVRSQAAGAISPSQEMARRAVARIASEKQMQGMIAPHGQLTKPAAVNENINLGQSTHAVWNKNIEGSGVSQSISTATALQHLDEALNQAPNRPVADSPTSLSPFRMAPARPSTAAPEASSKIVREFRAMQVQTDARIIELKTKYKLNEDQIASVYHHSKLSGAEVKSLTDPERHTEEEIKKTGLVKLPFMDADHKEELARLYLLQKTMNKDANSINQLLQHMHDSKDPIHAHMGDMKFISYVLKSKDNLAACKEPKYKELNHSDEELACLYGYTTGDYTTLNSALRAAGNESIKDAGNKTYIDHIVSGMRKIPDYTLADGASKGNHDRS